MGRTRKPCPGCGEVVEHRRADAVCGYCQRMIEAGKKYAKQQQRRFGAPYSIPFAPHGFPYVRHCGDGSLRQFRSAFFDLCVAVSVEPAKATYSNEALVPNEGLGYSHGQVYLEPANRDALRELYAAVQAIAGESYREGKRDGEAFVQALCSGEVSLRELNDSTIGEGGG